MGYKHFGVNTGGLPVDLIKRFVDDHGIEIFIETGTAGGDSVSEARFIFKECHTIEIVEDRANVRQYASNITLHTGDSANLLKSISDQYKGSKIFFWLDAHYSEPHESPEGTNECPLLDEIKAIRGHQGVILIDDARLFYGRPPWPCNPDKGWPKFDEVFTTLQTNFPNNRITIVDDYILCYHESMVETFKTYWYDTYSTRFPHEDEKLKQSVRAAYQALKIYML